MFQAQWCEEIVSVIPRIIEALEESDLAVRDATLDSLSRLAHMGPRMHHHTAFLSVCSFRFEAELREGLQPAVPKIAAVLKLKPDSEAALISLLRLADNSTLLFFLLGILNPI
jgi:hypothetical protein